MRRLLLCTLCFGVLSSSAAWSAYDERAPYLGTKTLYKPQQEASTYEQPPDNCQPIFISLLGRHGSRHVGSQKEFEAAWKAFQKAEDEGSLTKLGMKAYNWLKELHESKELGLLTKEGYKELYGIGKRMAEQYPDLFEDAAVELSTTSVKRTQQSRDAFQDGLLSQLDGDVDFKYTQAKPGEDYELRFFDSCTRYKSYQHGEGKERREMIQDWVLGAEVTKRQIYQTMENLMKSPLPLTKLGDENTKVVGELNSLCQSDYNVQPKKGEKKFCSLLDKDLRHSFLYGGDDLETYYILGPVQTAQDHDNQSINFTMACTALNSFLDDIESAAQNTNATVAHLRFAHLETVLPLSVLMGLHQTDKDLDAHENPQWRSEEFAGMGSNVQWIAYSCKSGDQKNYKVKMLYNEKEVKFPAPGCENSYYCDWELLKAYYHELYRYYGLGSCSLGEWNRVCGNVK